MPTESVEEPLVAVVMPALDEAGKIGRVIDVRLMTTAFHSASLVAPELHRSNGTRRALSPAR